jgi:ABC-type Fe3+-hydroxamate transport system substrate-binding protein
MKNYVLAMSALAATALLSACVEDTGSAMPSEATQACLRAVTVETNNPDVVLLNSSFSQAGTEVIVGVGENRAPWQCIAYQDGSTSRPMSLTNEGSL